MLLGNTYLLISKNCKRLIGLTMAGQDDALEIFYHELRIKTEDVPIYQVDSMICMHN